MGLQGFYNLGGIELDNCYIHISRFQVNTKYVKMGDSTTHTKYIIIDYDYSMFKNFATAKNDTNNPIKQFIRNRFSFQVVDNSIEDVWQLIYDDIKRKQYFTEFIEDTE